MWAYGTKRVITTGKERQIEWPSVPKRDFSFWKRSMEQWHNLAPLRVVLQTDECPWESKLERVVPSSRRDCYSWKGKLFHCGTHITCWAWDPAAVMSQLHRCDNLPSLKWAVERRGQRKGGGQPEEKCQGICSSPPVSGCSTVPAAAATNPLSPTLSSSTASSAASETTRPADLCGMAGPFNILAQRTWGKIPSLRSTGPSSLPSHIRQCLIGHSRGRGPWKPTQSAVGNHQQWLSLQLSTLQANKQGSRWEPCIAWILNESLETALSPPAEWHSCVFLKKKTKRERENVVR